MRTMSDVRLAAPNFCNATALYCIGDGYQPYSQRRATKQIVPLRAPISGGAIADFVDRGRPDKHVRDDTDRISGSAGTAMRGRNHCR